MSLKVAICGGSGYTGAELLRLLQDHPHVEITAITSEKSAGSSPAELFPHLPESGRLRFEKLVPGNLIGKADLFFMALPHRLSQPAVDRFVRAGKYVIDLSADYRLKDKDVYEQWYGTPHRFAATLKKAVYGLPELHRAEIKRASLVANPGCYPTAAILGVYPALKAGLAGPREIVIDSKSGTSGAGRHPGERFSFSEVNDNFSAYSVASHRHTPEIEQELSAIAGLKKTLKVNFTPHLLPVDRGILSTIYLKARDAKLTTGEALQAYQKAYRDEPFVNVLAGEKLPSLKAVRGTNRCEIGLKMDARTGTLIVVTAIDNLVKGASGQAVQNMNLMAGWPEDTALKATALHP